MSFITLDSKPSEVIKNVWQMLLHGKKTYNTPFHHAQLASVDANSNPQLRTMILRQVDEVQNTITFHTDIRSRKVQELNANPNVHCLFYDEPARLQVRLQAIAKIHYNDELALAAWKMARVQSQLSYSTEYAPSTVLKAPVIVDVNRTNASEEELLKAQNNFALIVCTIQCIDVLYLNHRSNLRVGYDCKSNQAFWVHP
jgi:pyridoxamine 5'-phosphate oxidase